MWNGKIFGESGRSFLISENGKDGSKQYAKTIYNEPEKYFTDDILKQIDEAAKKEYSYGNTEI